MNKEELMKNISKRTNGDIYFGVVGAVRTGKSTFIKKVIENLVIPYIEDEFEKKRTFDEIPQSSKGKSIMTIEPKFVPSTVAKIHIDEIECNIRLVDCVGYIIDNAQGASDENGPRMVKTPWFSEDIPFSEAAEIGTSKVIKDHSTIGIVVTTDGSIGDFDRNDYVDAEEKVVSELKEIGKPFVIVLNSTHPSLPETQNLSNKLMEKYNVPVLPISVESLNEKDITAILKEALYEFPVEEIKFNMPEWITVLKPNHYIKKSFIETIKNSVIDINKVKDIDKITNYLLQNEFIEKAYISDVDTSLGNVTINLDTSSELYGLVLKEIINIDISNKADLLSLFQDFNEAKTEYDQIKYALNMVKQTGYGVATPSISDMKLSNPEIIKQGSRYGVRLKAIAPSIHMIRVDVQSTFEPIIGTEVQSKELIDYIMKDYETNPENIWKSEIFGRSLDSIVQEGIQSKISLMPENIRFKLNQTLTKIVNKGSNNLFAIVI